MLTAPHYMGFIMSFRNAHSVALTLCFGSLVACSSFSVSPELNQKPKIALVSVCAQAQPSINAGLLAGFQAAGSRYGQDVLPALKDQASAWAKQQLQANDAGPDGTSFMPDVNPPVIKQETYCAGSAPVPDLAALARRAAELGVDAVMAVNHSWSVQSQEQVRMSNVSVADGLEARVVLSVVVVSKNGQVWMNASQHSDSKVGSGGEQLVGGVSDDQIHRLLNASTAVAWSELAQKLKANR